MTKNNLKKLEKKIGKGKTKHAALNEAEKKGKKKKGKTSFGPVAPARGK